LEEAYSGLMGYKTCLYSTAPTEILSGNRQQPPSNGALFEGVKIWVVPSLHMSVTKHTSPNPETIDIAHIITTTWQLICINMQACIQYARILNQGVSAWQSNSLPTRPSGRLMHVYSWAIGHFECYK
jgi:hypothetical protein